MTKTFVVYDWCMSCDRAVKWTQHSFLLPILVICIHGHVVCRKVYLGYKKNNPCKKYAIKVMKKVDMINKNMASQGTFSLCCNLFILRVLQSLYIPVIWLHHHLLHGVDSNFVSGHMLTMWFMVCRWPRSQQGVWWLDWCSNRRWPLKAVYFDTLIEMVNVYSKAPLLHLAVAKWLVHLTAVWEDPGLNRAVDGCVYGDSCCNTQPWAWAVHLYCSA